MNVDSRLAPDAEFDDFPHAADREPARQRAARFFAEWQGHPPPAPVPPAPAVAELDEAEDARPEVEPVGLDRPARSRRGVVGIVVGILVGTVAALIVVVAVPVLAGWQPAAPAWSVRPGGGPTGAGISVRTVTLELDRPVEAGNAVELSWRSDSELEYAVVVAGAALPTKVLRVDRQRSLRVPVEPARQYCFLVQGTDGEHVYQTAPQPIRGAVCRL